MQKTLMYDGTIELNFDEAKHHYTIGDETVDGVTSVLQVINKPALIYWAANMAAEYVNQNLHVGVVDEIQKNELVEGCKKAHRVFKDSAATIGTMFHEWCEAYIKGKKPAIPTNAMLKNSVEQFLGWVKEFKVEFTESERIIYSKKYNYAGTMDFVARIGGTTVVGDLKTSSGIWDEMWFQTAAYKQALQEEFPKTKIDRTVIVRCGKDGKFEVKSMDDFEKNIEAFLAALTLYRRTKEMQYNNKLTK